MTFQRMVLVALGLLIHTNTVISASFNCNNATSTVEKMICQNTNESRVVSILDETLNKLYSNLIVNSNDPAGLKKEQLAWLKKVRDVCTDILCLNTVYTKRIEELENRNSGNPSQSHAPLGYSSEKLSLSNDAASSCFVYLFQNPKPFEVFFDGHIQRPGADFGQSNDAINFIGSEASPFKVMPLCNGNFVAFWIPVERGSSDSKLMVRIFDENIQYLGSDIRAGGGDNVFGTPDIVSLSNGNFVVAWGEGLPNSTYKIRAQLFDETGKAQSNAFDISGSGVSARLYRLKAGRFAALWSGKTGAMLRIFEGNGIPVTSELQIMSRLRGEPHGYVTSDGNINVFLWAHHYYFSILDDPFKEAQSYDANGNPLTGLLNDQDVMKLPGYQDVVEQFLEQEAYGLDITLRSYLRRNLNIDCSYSDFIKRSESFAIGAKKTTTIPRMQRFFVKFLDKTQEQCELLDQHKKERIE